MRQQPPVSKRAIAQVLAAIAVAFLVIVTMSWLEHQVPEVQLPAPVSIETALPDVELVTCERTLPNADPSETVIGPVGRITSVAANLCPRRFEGRLVTYVGEAVGDVLRRTGGAWVQVNDDAYALEVGPLPAHHQWAGTNSGLAIWLPDDVVDVVQRPGRRGLRGDVIIIEGILLRADPEDGGGLTIRATKASLLSAAAEIDRPLHRAQAILASLAALVTVGLSVRERTMRQRR